MPVEFEKKFAVDQHRVETVCREYHVKWLAVFGSYARGEAKAESDVDLLYELEPGTKMGFFTFGKLADDLSHAFGGRYIDLGTPKQLHWFIRDRVLHDAVVLYAR